MKDLAERNRDDWNRRNNGNRPAPPAKQILDAQRQAILAEYPRFLDTPEILPTLGRMIFEADTEFAQKAAIQAGEWRTPLMQWEQLSPFTQARWERLGAKVGHVLLEKCSRQIEALVQQAKVVQSGRAEKVLAIEDAEIVEEKRAG